MSEIRRKKIIGREVLKEQSGLKKETAEGMTVEQLLTASILDLKKMAPFYYAALCVVPRVESDEVAELAVSPDHIYYNSDFIAGQNRASAAFYLVHGIYHIIMQHHRRGKGRDPVKWNLACDIFINSCISKAYRIRPGIGAGVVTGPGGETAFMEMPAGEPYIEDIRIQTDTPEMIYYWLSKPDDTDAGKKLKKIEREGKTRLDIIDDDTSMSESETAQKQKSERLLKKVETTYDQIRPTAVGRGSAGDPMGQLLKLQDDSHLVDWRTVLQNRLVAAETDEKDLSHPDRRFVHRRLYIEGPVTEEDSLVDVKVCIDTSGSMSDDDIDLVLSQVRGILRQYRIRAELVFWDEEVESIRPFSSLHEFVRAAKDASGRGGTNPDCIFRRFSMRESHSYRGESARLFIIFSDGYFEPPDIRYKREFGSDTIWVMCTDGNVKWKKEAPSFGKVAYLKKPKNYEKLIKERQTDGNRNAQYAQRHTPGDYITD